MSLKEVIFPSLSASVGHRYLKHDVPEWNGLHSPGYHAYFILIVRQEKNAIELACGGPSTARSTTDAD